MAEPKKLSIREIVGGGYEKFWACKLRYRVVKGSRASKKSTTTALNIIVRMMQYPLANTLVVRQTAATLKDSFYTQLKWAIHRLGVDAYWRARVSPLELEYIPTGQKILFRGLDDPLKITSVTVAKGVLCWGVVEEAYEISEEDFNRLDESLRGDLPEGYFIQWTLVFNPWDSSCWIKARFFDTPHDNVLAMTTTYKCNEWLSDDDKAMFEDMRITDPERYKVAGEGSWGVASGQFFRQWSTSLHVVEPFDIPKGWMRFRSMDWGSAKPYACLWMAVDYDDNIWVYRELYGWGGKPNVGTMETAREVGKRITKLETARERVHYGVLDNACWSKTGVTGPSLAEEINDELYKKKLVTFGKSSKGRREGANAIKERLIGNKKKDGTFKPALFVFRNCVNLIRTLPQLSHDKRNPETYDTNGEDHCFVAGTMIKTKQGSKPIEDIRRGDYVLTRKGYKKVLAAGITNKAASVMTAVFSNGITLTGTGNHPVYVIDKGFVRFDEMHDGDKVIVLQEVELCPGNKQAQPTALSSMESRSDDIRCRTDWTAANTTDAMDGSENMESATCIKKCGSSITEKSLKDITSTTKTETHSTTIFQTLKSWLATITCLFMGSNDGKTKTQEPKELNSLTQYDHSQKHGISQTQGMSGTSNMENELLKKCQSDQRNSSFVNNVEDYSKSIPMLKRGRGFVLLNVPQSTDGTMESTTRQELASSAEKNSDATSTASKRLVLEHAEIKAVHWHTEQEEVYNLTVEDMPEYFANGILVHNCVDALAYGLLSRPWAPNRPGGSSARDSWKTEKSTRSAWTY